MYEIWQGIDSMIKDIELLTMYHDDLERSLFGFKKKADFINKDESNEIQKL